MQLVTPPSRFVLPQAVAGMAACTARAILHGKGGDVLGDARGEHPLMPSDETEIVRPVLARTMTMFDAQIAVALFAAFLLGMVAGSGMEIIVRGGRR